MLINWLEHKTNSAPDPRSALGRAASITGIAANALLFLVKQMHSVVRDAHTLKHVQVSG